MAQNAMPEMAWNSTTTPKEGAIVYVLAADDIGQYVIPFPSYFETTAGGMLKRVKSSMLLSRDGAQGMTMRVDATGAGLPPHGPARATQTAM